MEPDNDESLDQSLSCWAVLLVATADTAWSLLLMSYQYSRNISDIGKQPAISTVYNRLNPMIQIQIAEITFENEMQSSYQCNTSLPVSTKQSSSFSKRIEDLHSGTALNPYLPEIRHGLK